LCIICFNLVSLLQFTCSKTSDLPSICCVPLVVTHSSLVATSVSLLAGSSSLLPSLSRPKRASTFLGQSSSASFQMSPRWNCSVSGDVTPSSSVLRRRAHKLYSKFDSVVSLLFGLYVIHLYRSPSPQSNCSHLQM
jgi:hypothetical protein